FSDSGKIMIEASDIDYLKTPLLTFNAPEISSSSLSNTRLIFDIIADDIDSINKDSSKKSFYIEHTANYNYGTPSLSKTLPALNIVDAKADSSLEKNNYIELDANKKDNNKEYDSECEYRENEILLDKNKQEENDPPKKRKRGTRIVKKDKGKKLTIG
ncbi:11094_t:CDS:1, partial [Gigaspora margarita]